VKLRWADPVVTRVAAVLVRALAATWRYHEHGREHLDALRGRAYVYALWHSRILPLLYLHRAENVVLLISRHRDGGYLADLAHGWGYRTVRGSSQRGGEVGLLGVVHALQGGDVVAITPDGPRGPAEEVKPGAVAAAQLAGVPILCIGARASAAWRLRSWDGFVIPKPFARIDVVYAVPITVSAGKEAARAGVTSLQRALQEVTHGG
jgi:lysophospholipid acyltransferase (LPLAT)-like uncharacterized protein